MPDLNLKGEKTPAPGAVPAVATHRGQRIEFLISLGTTLLSLVAVIAFVLSSSSAFETVESAELPSSRPASVDSSGGVPAILDSTISDSMDADTLSGSLTHDPELVGNAALEDDSGRYTIQVSAWPSEWKAMQEAERWKMLGFNVYIFKNKPDSSGAIWYGVRMGRYKTFADAKRMAESMADFLGRGYTIEENR